MKRNLLFLLFTVASIPTLHGQTTIISGQIGNLTNDTIKIIFQIDNITRQRKVHALPVKDGKFADTFQITKPVYFYTNEGSNYVNGLIEPGDRLTILYNADSINTTLKVMGNTNEEMLFINSLVTLNLYDRLKEQLVIAKTKKYPFDHMFDYVDSIGNSMLNKLDSIKHFINSETYDLLRADVSATVMGSKYRSVGLVYHESVYETLQERQNELTFTSREYLQNILSFDQTLFYSASYINEVYNILFKDYDALVLAGKANKNLIDKYAHISKMLPGRLKTPVLTLFLEHDIGKLNQAEDLETLIREIYSSPNDSVYKNYIEKRYSDATAFKKGMDAPGFILENEKGEKVTLAYFKGKVVYIDFWYAACGPCHVLFKTIEPVKKHFSSRNEVVFLNISIDPKEVWEVAVNKYKVQGYHVFTENKGANHPIINLYKVVSYPTTCLIDKNGKVFIANPSNIPEELQKEIEKALTIENK